MNVRVNPAALSRKAEWLYKRMEESREGIEHHDLLGKKRRHGRKPRNWSQEVEGVGRQLYVGSVIPVRYER